MSYKTVNLLAHTYDRLRAYKVAGRSFDDVIIDLMERLPVREYHREALRALETRGPARGRAVFEREMDRSWGRLLKSRRRVVPRRRRG